MEVETATNTAGQLPQGYTAYYCEVMALIRALGHALNEAEVHNNYGMEIAIISKSQSLHNRFQREWDHLDQVNYARKPPWDQVPQLLRQLHVKPTTIWVPNIKEETFEMAFLHGEVKDQLALCRSALLDKHAKDLSLD